MLLRRTLALLPFVALFGAIPAACSDPSQPVTQSADGGADASTPIEDAGPAPAEDAGAVCNALTTKNLAVSHFRGVADSAPEPLGGTLEDGTYVLEETLVYGQPDLEGLEDSFRKLVIRGSTVQSVIDPSPDHSSGDRTATEAWAVGGTTLHIVKQCPTSGDFRTADFTVEKPDGGGTRLLVFGGTKSAPAALVFVKQAL